MKSEEVFMLLKAGFAKSDFEKLGLLDGTEIAAPHAEPQAAAQTAPQTAPQAAEQTAPQSAPQASAQNNMNEIVDKLDKILSAYNLANVMSIQQPAPMSAHDSIASFINPPTEKE